jgi:alpha-L-rhamnosidase
MPSLNDKIPNAMPFKVMLFLLIFLDFRTSGQPNLQVTNEKINPCLLTDHWNAEWITHPDESVLDYGVFHFRKSFELNTQPVEFIIHVSADNRYRLFVNGRAVCFGPARGDPAHWFYESVDIASFLKPGKNVIAVVVWNFGEYKPWAQFSLKTAFILQGNSPIEEIVNTNPSWKVIKNYAYSPASAGAKETYGQFVVVGPCDRVDAALYPWGWESMAYDDQAWLRARTLDVGHPYGAGTDINWVLTSRRIPLMEQYRQSFTTIRRTSGEPVPQGFLAGRNTWTIEANQHITVLFDQGNLTTGYPELVVSGGKGSTIQMTYSESLFDSNGNKGNRNDISGKTMVGYSDYFLPDGSPLRLFRPLWFRTWRYLQLEIETQDAPLEVDGFSSEFSAYPLKENAQFESDRENLKQIWNVGWRTARLCANETYFDCPYYEQLQYVGDTRIQALISLYVAGDDRLVRNALLNFNESRNYEGLTQSRYPSSGTQFIPPYSLFWVDMIHDYWMMRDDPEFVKGFLKGIEDVITWYTQRISPETGLLGRVTYWNFVDWAIEWPWITENRIGGVPSGGQEGNSSVLSLQLAYAVERAGELFQHFGLSAKAETYRQLAQHITRAVYSTCWDASHGYLAETPDRKEFSMHAQIFGVLTNTIPENQQKLFTERFMNDKSLIQPTLYFRFYLTQALKKAGLADRYLETLDLWEEMLQKGLTTFAENPDPSRSDCHAWSASPNYDLLATVAGIRPGSPGFKTIQMEPALGALAFIKGRMPHPAGTIVFDLKRNGNGGITGTVELPEGLTGRFLWRGISIPLQGRTVIDL